MTDNIIDKITPEVIKKAIKGSNEDQRKMMEDKDWENEFDERFSESKYYKTLKQFISQKIQEAKEETKPIFEGKPTDNFEDKFQNELPKHKFKIGGEGYFVRLSTAEQVGRKYIEKAKEETKREIIKELEKWADKNTQLLFRKYTNEFIAKPDLISKLKKI